MLSVIYSWPWKTAPKIELSMGPRLRGDDTLVDVSRISTEAALQSWSVVPAIGGPDFPRKREPMLSVIYSWPWKTAPKIELSMGPRLRGDDTLVDVSWISTEAALQSWSVVPAIGGPDFP
jgi:hypothetical protein